MFYSVVAHGFLQFFKSAGFYLTNALPRNAKALAEFMQGRRGNVSQRHYFLPLMNNNRKKWVRVWNKFLPAKI